MNSDGATRTGAYEIKFFVDESIAEKVLERARSIMQPDPHSESDRVDGYRVNSIYFDTPAFEVYHRVGVHGRQKFRLRRYGDMQAVFAERKAKSKGWVRKRRTLIEEDKVAWFQMPLETHDWEARWFHTRLKHRELRPTLQLSYDRSARVMETEQGLIRLTIDRELQCRSHGDFVFPKNFEGTTLLRGLYILELKYRVAMPDLFKEMMYSFQLVPQSISKYRIGMSQQIEVGASERSILPLAPSSESSLPRHRDDETSKARWA